MPYAEPDSSYVDDIDGLKQNQPGGWQRWDVYNRPCGQFFLLGTWRKIGLLKPASVHRRILRSLGDDKYIHFAYLPVGFSTREGVILEGESS